MKKKMMTMMMRPGRKMRVMELDFIKIATSP